MNMSKVSGELEHTKKFNIMEYLKWKIKISVVESTFIDRILSIFGISVEKPTKYLPATNKYFIKILFFKISVISYITLFIIIFYLYKVSILNFFLLLLFSIFVPITPPLITAISLHLIRIDRKYKTEKELIFFILVMSIYSSVNKIEYGLRTLASSFKDVLSTISSEVKTWIIRNELENKSLDDICIQESSLHPSEEFSNLIHQYINFKYTGGNITNFFIDRLDKKITELKDKWDIMWRNVSSQLEIILILFGLTPIMFSLTSFITNIDTLFRASYILYVLIPLLGLVVFIIIDGKLPYQSIIVMKYPKSIYVCSIFLFLLPNIIYKIFEIKIPLIILISINLLLVLIPPSIYGIKLWRYVKSEEIGALLFLETAEEWLRHGYTLENVIDKVNLDVFPIRFKEIILAYRKGLMEGSEPNTIIKKIPIYSNLVYVMLKVINEILYVGGGLKEIIRLRKVVDSYVYVKKRVIDASILPIILSIIIPIVGIYSIKIVKELCNLIFTSNLPLLYISKVTYLNAFSISLNILLIGIFISSLLLAKTVGGSLKYTQYALLPMLSLIISLITILNPI